MIIITFALYVVVSSVLIVPFVARYLIVRRQDKNILDGHPVQLVHRFTAPIPAATETEAYYTSRFLNHS